MTSNESECTLASAIFRKGTALFWFWLVFGGLLLLLNVAAEFVTESDDQLVTIGERALGALEPDPTLQ